MFELRCSKFELLCSESAGQSKSEGAGSSKSSKIPLVAGVDLNHERRTTGQASLFQPSVLSLRLLQERNVWVGVFPQREKVLISGARVLGSKRADHHGTAYDQQRTLPHSNDSMGSSKPVRFLLPYFSKDRISMNARIFRIMNFDPNWQQLPRSDLPDIRVCRI